MNKRWKELAEQASHQSPDGYPVTIPYSKDFAEKFAELIIRDCVDEIESQYGGGRELEDGTHSKDWDDALECASAMIRTHFGIERKLN